MSGDRYIIQDQYACYFITMTVVYWIDIFSRREYRDIIVDSLNYCVDHKGLELNAWVLMTNHLHIVGRVVKNPDLAGVSGMSGFLRDFKKFTSKEIIKTMGSIPESRKDWLLDKFSFAARRTGRARNYKIWKDDNHAIDLDNNGIDTMQKVDYVHNNPVVSGWVLEPEHYAYSSAMDYAGGKGLVKVSIL